MVWIPVQALRNGVRCENLNFTRALRAKRIKDGEIERMDLAKAAIERLKMASDMSLRLYEQPLVITYSGGKDSDVLLHLAGKAGIQYEVLHSLTTADAPETVYHVKSTFRKLEIGGGEMHHRCAQAPRRNECNHVESDSEKTHASNQTGTLLLCGTQRGRWERKMDCNRRSLGGITKTEISRRYGSAA